MRRTLMVCAVMLAACALLCLPDRDVEAQGGGDYTLLAWNDLGMHCMDADYAVFSILPPFNTVRAQLIDQDGDLVTSGAGVVLTYEAVADPGGSINTSSQGKTNYWQFANQLYGGTNVVNEGLAGHDMPGAANVPQPMSFVAAENLWMAEGIPITPIDDSGAKRYYPMMRVTARAGANGPVLASTEVVLPVSDEMDCRLCHASDAGPAAMPSAGWVNDPDSERDHRLNVLRIHDELQAGNPTFAGALATAGYSAAGLEDTVVNGGTSILCASCHASNALPGTGIAGIAQLTTAMHAAHAAVTDPETGMSLDSSDNRSSCYRCHPGSETRCLRGAMGNAVAADGSLAMQCQNCHGDMSDVGSPTRVGWLEQPNCQACHTGTALSNNGQIRYVDAIDPATGSLRIAANDTFATQPDVPATGFSLYRFSEGHGGLQCEACHGSTHAEYPGLHGNDNLQSIGLQAHVGTIAECTACHDESPETFDQGPHGMHPIGDDWVDHHHDAAENGGHLACRSCHGMDYKGTVLSKTFDDRFFSYDFGSRSYGRGNLVGCYDCHDGPTDDDPVLNGMPTAQVATATSSGAPVSITLTGTDPDSDPLSYRIVEQPHAGTVALSGNLATYHPLPGFAGDDVFRFAVNDGDTDSLPASVTVTRGAESSTFGAGWAGTNGVPSIALDAPPVLGSNVNLLLGNSWGQPAGVAIVWSTERLLVPTWLGGTIVVRPDNVDWAGLASPGATIPLVLPNQPSLVGVSYHIQTLQFDPGASFLWSFSKGLTMTLGY